ncbi:MAG: PAS domain S-box protein [Thermoanaerobaculia bacterium]|nr:PAS domain S-box protein [Thermoanaerobaculia bacterium]
MSDAPPPAEPAGAHPAPGAPEPSALMALFDTVQGFLWMKDLDGRYTYCNDLFERSFGGGAGGVLGKTDFDLFPAETAILFQENDRQAVASGGVLVFDEEVRLRRDGTATLFESRKGPLRDATGRVVGIVGSSRAVADSKAAEDRLALEDHVLARIVAGEPLVGTLDAIARVIEAQSLDTAVTIYLLSPGGRVLRLAAGPRVPEATLRLLDELPVGETDSQSGAAAFRKEAVEVEDISTDPLWAGYRDVGLAHGIGSGFSTPLLSREGNVLGVLTLYLGRKGRLTERQRRLVDTAARIAAIAVARSREEEVLRDSEARYRLVSEKSADVIWLYDLRSERFEWVSPSIERLRGYTVAETLGQSLADVLTPESMALVAEQLLRALAEFAEKGEAAQPRTIELEQVRKDGSIVPTEVATTFVTDATGRVTHLQGITRDISERRRADLARREAEAFRDALIDASGDGIAVFDQEHRVVQTNSRFAEMLGCSREEVLSLRTWDFVADLTEEEVRSRFADLSRVHETFESRHRRKDGSVYDVEVSASGLSFNGENVLFTISRDISARRQAEVARERFQQQLLAAQKMESVGRLAGGVAHDFNNMLSVIQGHATLALDRVDPESPTAEDLREIQSAAQRSARLTRQLLAFARRQPTEPRTLDLDETIGRMRRMLGQLLGEDVRLRIVSGTSAARVRIDPAQVDQLLTNLCTNARDAIAGPGTVTIETACVVLDERWCSRRGAGRPGRWVRLTVTDDGCGMDAEVISHVFEPFFTTKQVGRGTGLGLASVHGIVEQNGGFLDVESEPGRGSSFHVFLPRLEGEESRAGRPAVRATPHGAGETLLLVEDEPALLGLVQRMLEGLGYRVLTALCGEEALEVAAENGSEIRLLVTDVVMPGMNGRELCEGLLATIPGLRCLFVSGHPADVLADRGLAGDGIRLLTKPFTAHELAVQVREALDSSRPARLPLD